MVAQRLSADPKGNSMKYAKQGPREFVPFEFNDITLENIRKACKAHYREDLVCDILASEQGPSCSRLDQVPSFKVIYVRFIKAETGISIPTKILERNPFRSRNPFQPPYAKVPRSHVPKSAASAYSSVQMTPSLVPKSLSALDMMKFGKIIKPVVKETRDIFVEEFNMNNNEWVTIGSVQFVIEMAHFEEGAFRYAFKAVSSDPKFNDGSYVVKRYKQTALDNITELNQSPEMQLRKVIQMNTLARNLAARFSEQCACILEISMKYAKQGPREFVPFEFNDITLENIRKACKAHYREDLACDILASEQGPSCSRLDQVPSFKVIYVRFIKAETGISIPTKILERNPFRSRNPFQPPYAKVPRSHVPQSAASAYSSVQMTPSLVPKSLSALDMMKFGKIIKPVVKETRDIFVEEFNMNNNEWVTIGSVQFVIEMAHFEEGAFRYAFKAVSSDPKFNDGSYVVKRYKQTALDNITELNQSPEMQLRKVIQMNTLARNLAARFSEQCACILEGFTKLTYNKVFWGKIGDEFVAIEKFIPGTFQKYINNDGTVVATANILADVIKKAEAFVHYTYSKSEGKLMVLDIQGVGNMLCDPEIATEDITDTDEEFYFCIGNLTTLGIQTFLSARVCNAYCEAVNIAIKE